MKILHVIPDSIYDPKQLYLGSTKDIRGRTEYFMERGISCDELPAKSKQGYTEELSRLSEKDLRQYNAIVLEMTFSPTAIKYIKKKSPHSLVLVRSHNAELLHRWDWTRAQGLTGKGLRSLRHTFINAKYDYLSGKFADFVISISHWENEHYWKHIVDKSKLKYVPFFLPESYNALMPKGIQKKMQCVNFTASAPNPLIAHATTNFIKAVENLEAEYNDWKFYITGNQSTYKIRTPERIKWTGFLEYPYRTLSESKAMVLLSDYGYGFKTKILEAVLSGTYIIMTKRLHDRMPEELHHYCIPVDTNSKASFREALEQCSRPFPEGNPNIELRKQAFSALDEILN